ncbi:MAG: hypothetical protein V7607_5470 [Solirubrobacteraceae bacterium]
MSTAWMSRRLALTVAVMIAAMASLGMQAELAYAGITDVAVGAGEKFVEKTLTIDEIKKDPESTFDFLVNNPELTDATKYPAFTRYLNWSTAIGLGLLGLIATASVIRYWASGLVSTNGGGGAIHALVRVGVAAIALMIFPEGYHMVQSLLNELCILVRDGPGGEEWSRTYGLVGEMDDWWMSSTLGFMLLALVFIKSMATELLGVMLAFLPFALALWPLEELAGPARAILQTILATMLLPLLWAVGFSVLGTFVPSDRDLHGLGPIAPVVQFTAFAAALYLLYKVPIVQIRQAALGGALPSVTRGAAAVVALGWSFAHLARGARGAGTGAAGAGHAASGPVPEGFYRRNGKPEYYDGKGRVFADASDSAGYRARHLAALRNANRAEAENMADRRGQPYHRGDISGPSLPGGPRTPTPPGGPQTPWVRRQPASAGMPPARPQEPLRLGVLRHPDGTVRSIPLALPAGPAQTALPSGLAVRYGGGELITERTLADGTKWRTYEPTTTAADLGVESVGRATYHADTPNETEIFYQRFSDGARPALELSELASSPPSPVVDASQPPTTDAGDGTRLAQPPADHDDTDSST